MSTPNADSVFEVEAIPSSGGRCDHCEGTQADFYFNGHQFCCECMSELTSWILDGGMVEDPDLFAYVLDDAQIDSSGAQS